SAACAIIERRCSAVITKTTRGPSEQAPRVSTARTPSSRRPAWTARAAAPGLPRKRSAALLLGEPLAQVDRGREVALRAVAAVRGDRGEIDAGGRAVGVDVALDLGAPEAGPVGRVLGLDDGVPVPEAEREQDLLAEDAQVAEVHDVGVRP